MLPFTRLTHVHHNTELPDLQRDDVPVEASDLRDVDRVGDIV